jgi:lipopolysaccharide/colanic/teichoic acid biosynthesis glycosyltransferase
MTTIAVGTKVILGDHVRIAGRSLLAGYPGHPLDAQENAIPFFSERTYGVTPGITGLAQVYQGYDTSIEDIRSKVGFDHRYALALGSFWSWIKMDIFIMFRTLSVMVMGRGQ